MNVLFVNACVRENSRTFRLCGKYIEKYYSRDNLSELDLNAENIYPLNRLTLSKRNSDIENTDFSADAYSYAKAFARADEIIIGAPYWDFSIPAILKIYFEQICVCGITFEYGEHGSIGLCRAKKLVYITTAGGCIGASLPIYINELCGLFGIKENTLIKAEGLYIRDNNADNIINNVEFCL